MHRNRQKLWRQLLRYSLSEEQGILNDMKSAFNIQENQKSKIVNLKSDD
jgi:hypothetical protein